ncbi:hypothetical protein [Epilithonimonas hungarica]|uniref:Uncharacterized protein n=1 Tax=Epilithonimonas hungarica TaxID=454006 RepID=A0A1G7JVW7_9FLAO|nr:hypothetical protein [Epilithonimonas hungarica]SDF29087.1 hypothetical protein SAMN05421825_1497 [Epilithonimonas hungarica]
MIKFQYFPKSKAIPDHLQNVVSIFSQKLEKINSGNFQHSSNDVLNEVASGLENLGFTIEKSKKNADKIKVPVLFGINGKLEKYFDADGFNPITRTVIEVEAGRAVTNYQFLKDLFQACMMTDVDYLVIAVRVTYRKNPDFQNVITFFDTLFVSGRLKLPLKGILIIGY